MNPEIATPPTADMEPAAPINFFIAAPIKVGVMSLLTFGVYDIYWMYKQWQAVAQSEPNKIHPFWRALFSIIFIGPLFNRMKIAQPILLAEAYIILSLSWRLPDPWWLISLFGFVPLMVAQARLNTRVGAVGVSAAFSTKAKLVAAVGAVCLALATYGTFAP